METKIAPLALTKGAGGKPRVRGRKIDGMASTDDLDSHGDIVVPSAFNRAVREWKADRHIIPLIDTHDYRSINRVLGRMIDAEIRRNGLWTEWEVVDSPSGDEALARIKGGFVNGLSIGYWVINAEEPTRDEQRAGVVRRLTELGLKEVSLVAFPSNPSTRIKAGGGGDSARQDLERRVELAMKRSGWIPATGSERRDLERRIDLARRRAGLYFPTPGF